MLPPTEASARPHYTRNVLLQMLAVFLLLGGVIIWQWDVVRQIYLKNQINAIGWAVNGGIVLLFLCGLGALVGRFLEYRLQESAIARFLFNLEQERDPLDEVDERCMLAGRWLISAELRPELCRYQPECIGVDPAGHGIQPQQFSQVCSQRADSHRRLRHHRFAVHVPAGSV